MQLFKFFHIENTSKQQKIVVFMNMVPMLLRQFRRLAQGHCWMELCQLTKTANFKVTPMKKHI